MRHAGKVLFFPTSADWRGWLDQHAASEPELTVGFWKVGSSRPSMSWAESVDEALCVGWIDGVRRRLDDLSYSIRFTPRRPGSTWSAVNVAKVAALEAQGRMTDVGRAAFAGLRSDRTATYAYEKPLADVDLTFLQADPDAWSFWQAQPASYRRVVQYWLTSAKRPLTRATRMAQLLADCQAGLRIKSQRWS